MDVPPRRACAGAPVSSGGMRTRREGNRPGDAPRESIESPRMNRLLAAIPAESLEALRPHMEELTLELHTPLIVPNEPIPYTYFPLSCLASLVTVLEDGSTVEAGSVGHEGMVGIPILLNAATTPMQTVVQIGGRAI